MTSWEELLLQAVGPLVTAVVGTLIIGTFVAWITRRAQDRRADNELRLQLIGEMTEAASGLYMATQHFWRKKEREEGVSAEELAQERKELDQQYREARVAGEKIERQLQAYFETNVPRRHWHAAIDLLTVRYFHLIEMDTEGLRRANAGDKHSGLTVQQLKIETRDNWAFIGNTYRKRLIEGTQAVMQEPIRPLTG
jgi:hypothetical protein